MISANSFKDEDYGSGLDNHFWRTWKAIWGQTASRAERAFWSSRVSVDDSFVLTLTGELNDGTPIEGQDCIDIVKKGKKENED